MTPSTATATVYEASYIDRPIQAVAGSNAIRHGVKINKGSQGAVQYSAVHCTGYLLALRSIRQAGSPESALEATVGGSTSVATQW
jgi:hypothetical protein